MPAIVMGAGDSGSCLLIGDREREIACPCKDQSRRIIEQLRTTIVVTELYPWVSDTFATQVFRNSLKSEVESAHQLSLVKGIDIVVNNTNLRAKEETVKRGKELQPAYKELTYDEESKHPVSVKILAGIIDSSPQEAGWNVYCNGRMVLQSDSTMITGWGAGGDQKIPRFHNQFSRFRGFVFFECDDATKLPWNTTKTGVDTNSAIYEATRNHMVEAMRPVIDFLNEIDSEKELPEDERHLTQYVDQARTVRLSKVTQQQAFGSPKPLTRTPVDRLVGISFKANADEVDEVKESLGVRTNKEVGEGVFAYYYDVEC